MSLNDAHQYCHKLSEGSHLLRIECGGENDFVTGLLRPPSKVWIDARARFDILDGSAGLFGPGFVFRWPNGKIVRFTKWADGNGVNVIDKLNKCVLMEETGAWTNADCDSTASVICEKRLHRPYEKFCPKHWVYNKETAACYRTISKTNMTILEADDRCFSFGLEHRQDAMLTSVSDEMENKFVLELAKEKNSNFEFVFLGGYGRSNNGNKWHWMDGSSFKYQNWDRGMPFGRRALAVLVMNKRGKWVNHYADRILSQFNAVAVCKFKS
ncbi:unnamed protein product [Caenorhabditis auriculariae]|uniref:C-type lectin domain-containing protein n=1 Tax=Caenorhabditis auriculariae TaxID=2777116 RepID=A0A8S1H348_9PELO|nr:unnamed protein product [Caenorhabditis auriculariae]